MSRATVELESLKKEAKGSLRDLFRERRNVVNMLLLLVLWIVASFDYFLINF